MTAIQLIERGRVAVTVGEHEVLVASTLVPEHHGLAVCPRLVDT